MITAPDGSRDGSRYQETTKRVPHENVHFYPSALDISYTRSGGGLYLLELFVTADQQETLSDAELLIALLDEADSLDSMSEDAAISRLHRPVLMTSL